jgi:hypothetical protein
MSNNKIESPSKCPRACRKGKLFVRRSSTGEINDIFHVDADGNLFLREVHHLLNLTTNSKTDKEKKKYEDDRTKTMKMKFPLLRIFRTKKSKVTWKPEATSIDTTQYDKHECCSILHDVCDNANHSNGDTKNHVNLQNPRGVDNSTTLTRRRSVETRVTWKPAIMYCGDDTKPKILNCDSNLHEGCDKSKDKRPNRDTENQYNLQGAGDRLQFEIRSTSRGRNQADMDAGEY